jgi:hypothetical protein
MKVYINGTVDSNTYSDTNAYIAGDWYIGKRSPSISAGSHMEGLFSDYRFVNGTAVYTSNFTPPTEPLTAITNTKILLGNLPYLRDQSTSNHTITVGGNTSLEPRSVFDNAAYSEASHGASAYFDGTNDHISAANHADFNVGSSDFTLECWAYIESTTSNGGICGLYNTSTNQRSYIIHQTDTSNHFGVAMSSNGTFESGSGIDSNVDIIEYLNQWVHLALTKSGTNATLYLNGNSIGTTSSAPSTLHASTGEFVVGKLNGANVHTTGYVSDVRLVNGTAVYTSNFTPPTVPLTAITNTKFLLNPETSISDLSQKHALTCYGNVATDATTVKFAGTKSIAFNGTGDYLIFSNGTPSTTDLTFDEEFTIEFWAYLNATNQTTIFYSCGGGTANWSATTGNESSFFIYNNSLYHQSSQGGSFHSDNISIPSVVQTGEWQHWAVTCDANADCKWYLNGTLMWSYAHVFPTKKTGTIWRAVIGAGQYLTDDNLDGYIQDFRITKGLVRYTANFTPPTEELQG